jgi:hypothetical protein
LRRPFDEALFSSRHTPLVAGSCQPRGSGLHLRRTGAVDLESSPANRPASDLQRSIMHSEGAHNAVPDRGVRNNLVPFDEGFASAPWT